jgi:hypothetical protein
MYRRWCELEIRGRLLLPIRGSFYILVLRFCVFLLTVEQRTSARRTSQAMSFTRIPPLPWGARLRRNGQKLFTTARFILAIPEPASNVA